MSHVPISLPLHSDPGAQAITLERLAECVRSLDPGTRALLDLSIRRRIRDDALAPVLRTDPFHLAWRRARALERVASELDSASPAPLADVRAALVQLPGDAWFGQGQLASSARAAELPTPSGSRALVPVSSSGDTRLAGEMVVRRLEQSEHRLLVAGGVSNSGEAIDRPRSSTIRGRFASAAGRAVRLLRRGRR